jgi:hypothetical protein
VGSKPHLCSSTGTHQVIEPMKIIANNLFSVCILYQGTLTEGGGWLDTVDLHINVASFCNKGT